MNKRKLARLKQLEQLAAAKLRREESIKKVAAAVKKKRKCGCRGRRRK